MIETIMKHPNIANKRSIVSTIIFTVLVTNPFFLARVKEHYGGKAGAKFVRDAQMKIGETDEHAACFDTDDCEMHNVGHYNAAGLIIIGTRFADAFNNLKK